VGVACSKAGTLGEVMASITRLRADHFRRVRFYLFSVGRAPGGSLSVGFRLPLSFHLGG
jgi:hypothetical protein